MLTIAIVNEKGGTGKTTTTVNLTAALGELGKRVLLVDLDGQAASSRWLGVEDDCRFADALWHGGGLEPIRDILPNVALAPGSGKLDSVAHDLRPTQGGQLRKLLTTMQGFDFALIDCPPSLGNRLIGNALLAATHAIVPVETSILAMDGLKILLTTLQDIADGFDHHVQLAGVVACRFDARTKLSRLILDELKRALPDKVFETVIRENVRLRECPGSGQSILQYAPDSHAAEDYRNLAKEVLTRLGQTERISPEQFQAVSGMREQVESMLRKVEQAAEPAAEPAAAASEPLPPETETQIATDIRHGDAETRREEETATPTIAECSEAAAPAPATVVGPDATAESDSFARTEQPAAILIGQTAEVEQPGQPEQPTETTHAVKTAQPIPAEQPAATWPAEVEKQTQASPAIAERFEELSPYGKAPPGAVELADENMPETMEEIFAGQPLMPPQPPAPSPLGDVLTIDAQGQPAPVAEPLNVEIPEPSPRIDEAAEAEPAAHEAPPEPADRHDAPSAVSHAPAGKEQDFPALREVLQKMAQEPAKAKPAVKPAPKKESPWQKMLRAVGVDR